MNDRPSALSDTPTGYPDWLADLKSRIHTALQRAALAVNRELVLLYWQIGRDILARQIYRSKRPICGKADIILREKCLSSALLSAQPACNKASR